jgi:hypothetical protein
MNHLFSQNAGSGLDKSVRHLVEGLKLSKIESCKIGGIFTLINLEGNWRRYNSEMRKATEGRFIEANIPVFRESLEWRSQNPPFGEEKVSVFPKCIGPRRTITAFTLILLHAFVADNTFYRT